MRKPLTILAICATVGVGFSAPASAVAKPATPSGILVMSADSAATGDFTLRSPATVQVRHLASAGYADGWSFQGCGDVRGFYLRPVGGDRGGGAGAVDLAGLRYGAPNDVALPGNAIPRAPVPLGALVFSGPADQSPPVDQAVRLPAGRYRLHVLATRPCDIRLPLGGYHGVVRAWATRPLRLQYAVDSLDTPVHQDIPAAPAPRAGYAVHTVEATAATMAIAFVHRVGYETGVLMTSVHAWEVCIEAEAAPACSERVAPGSAPPPGDFYANTVMVTPVDVSPATPVNWPFDTSATDIGYFYRPGVLAPGYQTAKTMIVSLPSSRVQGAVLAFDVA